MFRKIGLAILAALFATAALAVDYGWSPSTGLEAFHGAFVTQGAQPVLSGCATISAAAGGATGGKFATSGTSCNLVITFPSAAPNGWCCKANDLTTPANAINQNATTTTSATFAGTTVAADVVQWFCVGY